MRFHLPRAASLLPRSSGSALLTPQQQQHQPTPAAPAAARQQSRTPAPKHKAAFDYYDPAAADAVTGAFTRISNGEKWHAPIFPPIQKQAGRGGKASRGHGAGKRHSQKKTKPRGRPAGPARQSGPAYYSSFTQQHWSKLPPAAGPVRCAKMPFLQKQHIDSLFTDLPMLARIFGEHGYGRIAAEGAFPGCIKGACRQELVQAFLTKVASVLLLPADAPRDWNVFGGSIGGNQQDVGASKRASAGAASSSTAPAGPNEGSMCWAYCPEKVREAPGFQVQEKGYVNACLGVDVSPDGFHAEPSISSTSCSTRMQLRPRAVQIRDDACGQLEAVGSDEGADKPKSRPVKEFLHRMLCCLFHGAPQFVLDKRGGQAHIKELVTEVSHNCHNPWCLNPHHMTWEPHFKNMEHSRSAHK